MGRSPSTRARNRLIDGVRIRTLGDRHCSTKCPLFKDTGDCVLLTGTKWCLSCEYKRKTLVGRAYYVRCKPCHRLERIVIRRDLGEKG